MKRLVQVQKAMHAKKWQSCLNAPTNTLVSSWTMGFKVAIQLVLGFLLLQRHVFELIPKFLFTEYSLWSTLLGTYLDQTTCHYL